MKEIFLGGFVLQRYLPVLIFSLSLWSSQLAYAKKAVNSVSSNGGNCVFSCIGGNQSCPDDSYQGNFNLDADWDYSNGNCSASGLTAGQCFEIAEDHCFNESIVTFTPSCSQIFGKVDTVQTSDEAESDELTQIFRKFAQQINSLSTQGVK